MLLSFSVLAEQWVPKYEGTAPDQVQQTLRKLVPSATILPENQLTSKEISGHYADPGKASRKRGGPALSGSDLYLFPDQKYIYMRWADILPPTIYDKGTWTLKNGFVTLKSDKSVQQKDFPKDQTYIALTAPATNSPILLMGLRWDYSYFLDHAGNDPTFTLLLCSHEKQENIQPSESLALQKKLMKKGWRPEWFKN